MTEILEINLKVRLLKYLEIENTNIENLYSLFYSYIAC